MYSNTCLAYEEVTAELGRLEGVFVITAQGKYNTITMMLSYAQAATLSKGLQRLLAQTEIKRLADVKDPALLGGMELEYKEEQAFTDAASFGDADQAVERENERKGFSLAVSRTA